MAETPEQKYDRIAAAVQQTILNSFPNPNRVGCPGDVRLREVAARGTIVEDDDWQHITHCSECYGEFLAAKDQIRRAGRRARTLGLIGGAALLVLVVAAVLLSCFPAVVFGGGYGRGGARPSADADKED